MTYDNNIDWGEIYESTWWGVGVDTNTIDWGIVYKIIAIKTIGSIRTLTTKMRLTFGMIFKK
jgi:hypothetical protein